MTKLQELEKRIASLQKAVYEDDRFRRDDLRNIAERVRLIEKRHRDFDKSLWAVLTHGFFAAIAALLTYGIATMP